MNKRTLLSAVDFVLLSLSYFVAYGTKRRSLMLTPDYLNFLLILYLLWLISLFASNKHKFVLPKKIKWDVDPFLRSYVYLAILLFVAIFAFKLFSYSRFIVLATLILYLLSQAIFFLALYLYSGGPNIKTITWEEKWEEFQAASERQDLRIRIDAEGREVKTPFRLQLKDKIFPANPAFFEFLDRQISLDRISGQAAVCIDANRTSDVKGIAHKRLEFIINLHVINDILRINEFFISVNQKLERGGYFVGVVETLNQRYKRKFAKYPRQLWRFLQLLDFIWTRVIPKLPALKKFYFLIHGKNRRVLSQYELFGRLSFCGFAVQETKEIGQRLYFVSTRVRLPRDDKNPSFGPIFKQRRIGLQGEVIYTYKFRTMHPYSEYIHKYMYEKFSLNHIGKIRDDPRITGWGRFMRRYWLDEVPMLINLLRGDLKLVGVRPISYSFLSIYPEDLKRERIKYRPGLIPALYADRPRSIAEIWQSERRYILRYSVHPLRTDITYFLKILYNIVVRGYRSL